MSSHKSKGNDEDDGLSDDEEKNNGQEHLKLQQTQSLIIDIKKNNNNNNKESDNSNNNNNNGQRFVILAEGTHTSVTETDIVHEIEMDIKNDSIVFETKQQQQGDITMAATSSRNISNNDISNNNVMHIQEQHKQQQDLSASSKKSDLIRSSSSSPIQNDDKAEEMALATSQRTQNLSENEQQLEQLSPSKALTLPMQSKQMATALGEVFKFFEITAPPSSQLQQQQQSMDIIINDIVANVEQQQQQQQHHNSGQEQSERSEINDEPYSLHTPNQLNNLQQQQQQQQQQQHKLHINPNACSNVCQAQLLKFNSPTARTSNMNRLQQQQQQQQQQQHQYQQHSQQSSSTSISFIEPSRNIIIPINLGHSPTASLLRRPPLRYRMLHIFSDTLQFCHCPSFAKDCCIILIMYMGFTLLIFLFTLLSYSFLRSTVMTYQTAYNETTCPL